MKKADGKEVKFKKALLEQKERILNSHVMAVRDDLEISSDDLADEADFASSLVHQTVQTSIRDQGVFELKKIEHALERLNDGSYFECEECSETIEEKRLLAIPTTRYCISCAEHSELKRKVFA